MLALIILVDNGDREAVQEFHVHERRLALG
jgi:hypothetical protein